MLKITNDIYSKSTPEFLGALLLKYIQISKVFQNF